jgi:DNA modification methylase
MNSLYNESDIPGHLLQYFEPAEIGMENTPGEFIDKLVDVFKEVKRVLRSDGTCWINLGDSYAGSGKSGSTEEGRRKHKQFSKVETAARQVGPTKTGRIWPIAPGCKPSGMLKGKDLIGTPWMLAFAMRDDGWYLRNDIIWVKKTFSPESMKDRCTRSHEHIFMFSKTKQYYFDAEAIRKDTGANERDVWFIGLEHSREKHYAMYPTEIPRKIIKASTPQQGVCGSCGAPYKRKLSKYRPGSYNPGEICKKTQAGWGKDFSTNRPLTSIYRDSGQMKITTIGWEASCNCNSNIIPSVVLDPFGGSCTTALVAAEMNRDAIMIDIKDEYLKIGQDRLKSANYSRLLHNIVYI